MFYRCRVRLTVSVNVQILTVIRLVGQQVPLVVVETESALYLLYCLLLKTNNQMCGHLDSSRRSQAHQVKFGANSMIDYIV